MLLPNRLALTPGTSWPGPEPWEYWSLQVLCSRCSAEAVTLELRDRLAYLMGPTEAALRGPQVPMCREHAYLVETCGIIHVPTFQERVAFELPQPTEGARCPSCGTWEPDPKENCSVGESAVCSACDEPYRYDDPPESMECPACGEGLHLCPSCREWQRPDGPEPSWQCTDCYNYGLTEKWNEEERWWCADHEMSFQDEDDARNHWREHGTRAEVT